MAPITELFHIYTSDNELKEGLFGQIILYTFELLPYLNAHNIYPTWDIKSRKYGDSETFTVIPGVFDLAYKPDINHNKSLKFSKLRTKYKSALGCDWEYLNSLWSSYFTIPDRIVKCANQFDDLSDSLGIHYRGTDKITATWDTNPLSQDEYVLLISDFVSNHRDLKNIFVASDEPSFIEKLKRIFTSFTILHSNTLLNTNQNLLSMADRALLDCLLLSRCKYLLKTSSALSGFAKVLNPSLECYRTSASKLFSDVPYFPVAYIPILKSDSLIC